MFQWVTGKSNVLVNTRDRLGRTALLVALMSGAGADTVRELLTAGERLDLEAGCSTLIGHLTLLRLRSDVTEASSLLQ